MSNQFLHLNFVIFCIEIYFLLLLLDQSLISKWLILVIFLIDCIFISKDIINCWYIEKQLTFVYYLCILWPCYNCLLVLEVILLSYFLYKMIMLFVNKVSYFFLPNLYILYFLFLSYCITRTFSMVLNISGERKHSCSAHDLRKFLVFHY